MNHSQNKTGVLLVNLGTPDSYERKDVKKYLDEFLSDPRVLDINPLARRLLLDLVILPTRSGASAALYKKIWTDKGSPLMSITMELGDRLREALPVSYDVQVAMRYQSPSLEKTLEKFRDPAYDKIIVFPLFPQYASASTGSVHEKVMEIVGKWPVVPPIEFVNSYCNHPAFINAWAERAKEYRLEDYDYFLFSYHGLPERQIRKGDYTGSHCLNSGCCDSFRDVNKFCYRAQCYETTRQIVRRLGIAEGKYGVAFQSRLGKDPWIKPYSDFELKRLAEEGKKKILVFPPAFVADCLETIYEIGVEYDELFREHGGEKVQMVESLNAHPAWVAAVKEMIVAKTA
jgi:protoporphyrin/coproporphyrin ferrochelatase